MVHFVAECERDGEHGMWALKKNKSGLIIGKILVNIKGMDKLRFHSRESNHQPLSCDLGISSPSSNSLRLSRTINWGIIDLQRCNYYDLRSIFSSKFQSSMTTSHHKLLIRENRVFVNA